MNGVDVERVSRHDVGVLMRGTRSMLDFKVKFFNDRQPSGLLATEHWRPPEPLKGEMVCPSEKFPSEQERSERL